MAGIRILLAPWREIKDGLVEILETGLTGTFLVVAGLIAGWWVYVPCHELLHALACLATGGSVTRLEIAPQYGGALLARLFPFVVSGSDYAGRLSGFDTRGSDLVYLATDLGPFLLTIFPGVWAMRLAAAGRRRFLLGVFLPLGLAPFFSLTGDAYEIGSILVTRLGPWSDPSVSALLRGDDLFVKIGEVRAAHQSLLWLGLALSFAAGCAWASLTCLAAGGVAAALARVGDGRPLRPR